jgi:hypothetical protein
MLRPLIVFLAALDGALAASLAGERFWIYNGGPGGEASIGRAVDVYFYMVPIGAVICAGFAFVLMHRSGGFSPRDLRYPPLTIWEIGFSLCSVAGLSAFALWIALT